MVDPRHQLGRAAEDAVATWLTSRGWRIVGRRVRSPAGSEVDLVALDPGGALVALEIRARRHRRAGSAADSVVVQHVTRMRRTLASVASETGQSHAGLRVDLVALEPDAGNSGRWLARRIPGIG